MKKGAYWIKRTHLFRADEYICSICLVSSAKPYNTCPACGFKMKIQKYDPTWVDEIEAIDAIFDD